MPGEIGVVKADARGTEAMEIRVTFMLNTFALLEGGVVVVVIIVVVVVLQADIKQTADSRQFEI